MADTQSVNHPREDPSVPTHARSGPLERHPATRRPGLMLAVVTSPMRRAPIDDVLNEMAEDLAGQRNAPSSGKPQNAGPLGLQSVELYTAADLEQLSDADMLVHTITVGGCIGAMQEQQRLIDAEEERRKIHRRRLAAEAVARKRAELTDAERYLAEIDAALARIDSSQTA